MQLSRVQKIKPQESAILDGNLQGFSKTSIDVAELPAGLYLLQFYQKDDVGLTSKFMVFHLTRKNKFFIAPFSTGSRPVDQIDSIRERFR